MGVLLATMDGFEYPTSDGTINSNLANYNNNIGHPVTVGSYAPTPYGLYDMVGNAEELTSTLNINYDGVYIARGRDWTSTPNYSLSLTFWRLAGYSQYTGFRVVLADTSNSDQEIIDPVLSDYDLIDTPITAVQGDSFTVKFQIKNPNDTTVFAILDLRYKNNEMEWDEFSPRSHIVKLLPGTKWYERSCKVPENLPEKSV